MTFLNIRVWLVSSLFFATLCPVAMGSGQRHRIILTGSSTVAPLAAEIAKRFESLHPGVRVDVQTGGSSRGVADVRRGTADIGMVSRGLKPQERDLIPVTIAKDGISIILHRSNPVKELSKKQIVAIYTGNIRNWKEVGGLDHRITVINKAEGHSTLELFLKYFSLRASQIKAHVIIGDNAQGIKTVAGNKNSIGYVSIGTAEYSRNHNIAIKLLPMNHVAASIKNVASGTFPFSRPLNLVTKTPPVGLVKEFITFCRSSKVDDIISQQYFVPLAH